MARYTNDVAIRLAPARPVPKKVALRTGPRRLNARALAAFDEPSSAFVSKWRKVSASTERLRFDRKGRVCRAHGNVLERHATHARWIWLVGKPERIEKKARRAIDKAEQIGIAAISVWEVAAKVQLGKLRFDRPRSAWVDQALTTDPRFELL
jgi:hypothetical protein